MEVKVTPEVQKIINFLPQIKAKYPELLIEFSINGSRLSGKDEESHQVVFNRVRRMGGVPWVEYSNPHGYIEYMPLDQLSKNFSSISNISHSISIIIFYLSKRIIIMYSINGISNVKNHYNGFSHVSISLQIDGVATTVKLPEILTNIELYKYILTRKFGTQYKHFYKQFTYGPVTSQHFLLSGL